MQRDASGSHAPQTEQSPQERTPGATATKGTNQGIETTIIHEGLLPLRVEE
jgi:hypothetical protein